MAMCPAPTEDGVDALLDPTGCFCLGKPNRLECLGDIAGLGFVQELAPQLGEDVLGQGVNPLLTVFGVLPAGQQILVQRSGCLLEGGDLVLLVDLRFLF